MPFDIAIIATFVISFELKNIIPKAQTKTTPKALHYVFYFVCAFVGAI
jgi:hypothetical protein